MRKNDELFVDEIFVGDVVDLLAIVEGQLVFTRLDSEMNDNLKSSFICFTFAQLLPCTQSATLYDRQQGRERTPS